MAMVAVRPKFGAVDWDAPSDDELDVAGTPLRVQRLLRACMYNRPAEMELKWNAVKREWSDVTEDRTAYVTDDDDDDDDDDNCAGLGQPDKNLASCALGIVARHMRASADDAMEICAGDPPPPPTPLALVDKPYSFDANDKTSVAYQTMIGQVPKYAQSETEAMHGEVDGISHATAQFKPTDGVTFSSDFRFCKHAHITDRRLFVLSESWTVLSHPQPWMTWRVQPLVAGYRYGDIYVGLTEASVPYQYEGAVRAVDCERNTMSGPWFDVVRHDSEPVHRSGGDRRADFFVVEVDLYKQQGAVSCYEAHHAHHTSLDGVAPRWTEHFDLNGWHTARLCVSMHTMQDSIELVSCHRTQPNLPVREVLRGITPLA